MIQGVGFLKWLNKTLNVGVDGRSRQGGLTSHSITQSVLAHKKRDFTPSQKGIIVPDQKSAIQNGAPIISQASSAGNKCSNGDCERPSYKKGKCKHHFCNMVKNSLQKELRNIFRGPEKAYSSMDFYGRGYITEGDFLASIVMTRIPYSLDEVKEFLRQNNLFSNNSATQSGFDTSGSKPSANNVSDGMHLDHFKKTFFPQLYLINEAEQSDDDRQAKKNKEDLTNNKGKQKEIITDRLKKLEKILKDKLSNNWESVRKAFLALDSDYDGYITVEDILRHFGQEKGVNYNDLKKLIMDKDSRKQGKIGYTDFSKWVGNTIHQSEGFYFRHDSIKNPQFESNLIKNELNKMNMSKKIAQDSLINENLEKTVLDKIKFQWKTLRKAFMDLNMEKSGQILPEELKFYFQHWGLNLNDEQFKFLFDKFDMDKDGKISYKDFQLTVGSEIHPAEGLYFRQDKPQMMKIESCKHPKCWQPIHGQNYYCQLHLKLHQDQTVVIFEKFFRHINTKWSKFIKYVRSAAEPDDQNQIFMDKFIEILKKFKVELTEKEQTQILDSIPGRDEGNKRRINIARLYDQRYNMKLNKLYQKVDVHENDGEDDPVDQSGYTGQFYRPQNKSLLPITESELVDIIYKNNKLIEIIRTIKEIDKQHNGYVTTTELDDILKINYRQELANRDLKMIMKKYASIQNRVLVDYKKFRDSIVAQLKEINHNYTFAVTDTTISPQKTLQTRDLSSMKKNLGNRVFEALNKFIASKVDQIQEKKSQSKISGIDQQASSNLQKLQSNYQSSRNTDQIIVVKDFIRPKTRDPYNMPKKHYLKSNLNQTFNLQSKDFLNESTLDNYNNIMNQTLQESDPLNQSRLSLRKMSTIIESNNNRSNQLTKGQSSLLVNDYDVPQDNYNDYNLGHGQDLTNIQDLKRAQSSHGHVRMLQRSNTLNNSGVVNLLQKRNRRNINTSNGSDFRILSQNNSKALIEPITPGCNNEEINNLEINKNHTLGSPNFNSYIQLTKTNNTHMYNSSFLDSLQQKNSDSIKIKHFLNSKNTDQLNNSVSLMYQTLNSSNLQVSQLKFKQVLKSKLQYEWKNIYRMLCIVDRNGSGCVSLQDFENAIHQCGAFLTKEDLKRIGKIYRSQNDEEHMVEYQRMSVDLGMHLGSFNFLQSQQQSRQQNMQKLRNLYSSSEKKKPPHFTTTASLTSKQQSHQQNSIFSQNLKQETSKEEIKQILLTKLKQFKDLIGIYQRKNHQEQPIIPLGEFKAVLKGLGITLNSQTLQRFNMTKLPTSNLLDEDTQSTSHTNNNKPRSKSSHSLYGGFGGAHSGVSGLGINAQEFLRYYL